MMKRLLAFIRLSLLLAPVIVLTACPPAGGKLVPQAGEQVRVVTREDTGLTAEAQQSDVTVAASGNWSAGGTDVLLTINNASGKPARIDFTQARLTDNEQRTAALSSLIEYVQSGDQQQTVQLYTQAGGHAEAAVVTLAANTTRRLQAGFIYPGEDYRGGKLDNTATLTLPLEAPAGGKTNNFTLVFKYAGL